ncbi:MAG TPA: nucleotidyltransferase family protein [Allosphingosinicella sp.]|jgi:hypothetical protein
MVAQAGIEPSPAEGELEEERLRLQAIRSAVALAGGEPRGGLAAMPRPAELRVLAASRLDSIAYLQFQPDHPVQQLYDAIWLAQQAVVERFVEAAAAAGLVVLPVQGIEKNARYLRGHSLNRRGDLDFIVRAEDLPALARIAESQGFRQAAIAHEGGFLPLTAEQMGMGLAASGMEYQREYPFHGFMPFVAPERMLARIPQALNPLRRVGSKVELILALDMMTAYHESAPAPLHWERLRASGFRGAQTQAAELDLLFSAHRLYQKLAVAPGPHVTRMLAELVLVLVAEPDLDWEFLESAAMTCRMGAAAYYGLGTAAALIGHPSLHFIETRLANHADGSIRDEGWLPARLFPAGLLAAEMPDWLIR